MKSSKNKSSLIQNLINLCYLLVLPAVVGLGSWISKNSYWYPFSLFLAAELLLIYLVVIVYRTRLVEKTQQMELQKLGNLSTILSCAACRKDNLITFIPDQEERVEFSCEHCQKLNVVTMQFSVAVVTKPMDKLVAPPEMAADTSLS